LMSEIPGQSGHALPDLQQPACANRRHRSFLCGGVAISID
jgi:hypothetical protein